MKVAELKLYWLCVRQSLDRLVRTSLSLKMRFTLVLVISLVIVLGVLCPSAYMSHTNSSKTIQTNTNKGRPIIQSNITHLKEAIKSMRQQKRDIILSQSRKHKSHVPFRRNITELDNIKRKPSATMPLDSTRQSAKYLSEYIQSGIFWSTIVESFRPKGFTSNDDFEWLSSLYNRSVVRVESGCGRMQNRLLTFENGDKVCARYRKNNDQIQGEFVSFLLSRILQISNVPSSALVFFGTPDSVEFRWPKVKAKLKQAQWEAKPVVLTKFVDHLKAAYIPNGLRTSRRRLYPVWEDLGHLSTDELIELVQWSDLIVLDYLTANLDRMLNNMINERWNPQMMDSPAHNLLRQEQSNLLLFLDNESGLFHGYRLLKKYESLHRSLLDIVCVFRQSTISQLEKLHSLNEKEFASVLSARYRQYVLGSSTLTTAVLPKANLVTLRRRITQVLKQVAHCRAQFNPGK